MRRRRLVAALVTAVLAVGLVTALAAVPGAQAKNCPTRVGAVRTIHTSCAVASKVIIKAARKIPARRFRVYVRGRWHCNYARIAGHPTLTCERHYGAPRRQVVIAVI